MTYRIVESNYRDKHGKEIMKHYYVQKIKKFLGIEFWMSVKHVESYMSGSFKVTTVFETYDDAKNFVDDVLCKNIPTTKWSDKVISYNEC
jgi:hypothetical protein